MNKEMFNQMIEEIGLENILFFKNLNGELCSVGFEEFLKDDNSTLRCIHLKNTNYETGFKYNKFCNELKITLIFSTKQTKEDSGLMYCPYIPICKENNNENL